MRCLALDIGSSSIKGAVLDLETRSVGATIKRPFPQPKPGQPPGFFEVDTGEIETATAQVLQQLQDAAPDAREVYCAGQMGGLILVDGQGQPVGPYYSWRDQRTLRPSDSDSSYLEEIRSRWSSETLTELGSELQPGSTASLLFWLSQNDRLPDNAIPVSAADYVLGTLCGCPPFMHRTQALGLIDLSTLQWHRGALEELGLDDRVLPRLAEDHEAIGEFRASDGKSLTCYPSCGDQQCSLRGVGLAASELSLNVSTGSQVSLRTSAFKPGPYQTRCYFDGAFLNTITHLPAGRSLNVLVDLLTELATEEGISLQDPWASIARLTESISESDLEADLAFFAGPMGSAGAISNITIDNLNVGQLFYAAFRNMAENFAACANRLSPQKEWKSIVLSGGVTQSLPSLRRLIQNQFEESVRESQIGEESLRGLLEIALESGA